MREGCAVDAAALAPEDLTLLILLCYESRFHRRHLALVPRDSKGFRLGTGRIMETKDAIAPWPCL